MRLIDADELYEYLRTKWDGAELVTADGVIMAIEDAPTIDPLQEVLDEMKKLFVDEQGRCLLEHAEAMRIVKEVMQKYESEERQC